MIPDEHGVYVCLRVCECGCVGVWVWVGVCGGVVSSLYLFKETKSNSTRVNDLEQFLESKYHSAIKISRLCWRKTKARCTGWFYMST